MADLKSLKLNGVPIFDLIYPIGSIYQTRNSSFDPETEFGGTWERVKGKFIVGVDEDDSDFETSSSEGGEKKHTLTITEMPSHNHNWSGVNDGTTVTGQQGSYPFRIYQDRKTNWPGTKACIGNEGGSIPQQLASLHSLLHLGKNCLNFSHSISFQLRKEVA